ncbi:MAG: endolytic transglycosylase MltG [Nitrospirota bacterium]
MKRNIIFILVGIILLCWSYMTVELLIPLPIDNKKNREIEIPKGATFRQVLEILSKERLTRDKTLFLFIGRISGLDRKIRAGYYSIYGSMSPLDIFKMLKKGQIIEYEITVVEGDSLREIAEKLSEKGIINKEGFMQLAADKKFLSLYNVDAPTFEGYLFPDTYKIPKGMNHVDAVGMMINRMREKYSGELRIRTSELRLSEREILTLASIIEKEAITDAERPLISAVYHNRLRKGMPLQADPTSIYGIKSFSEKITEKDLRRKTQYNTYVIKGLPPGPIASPGIKSIIAALYPAKVSYIYFVSNNDGTHSFSVTPEEHLSAVESYREKKQMEKEIEIEDIEKTKKGIKVNGSS